MELLTKEQVIAEIHESLNKLIEIHYDIPEWVNEKLFKELHGKKILRSVCAEIMNKLSDYYDRSLGLYLKDMYNEDSSFTVHIGKYVLAFPFVSTEFEEPNYDDDISISNTAFTFSKGAADYIINVVGTKVCGGNIEYTATTKKLQESLGL